MPVSTIRIIIFPWWLAPPAGTAELLRNPKATVGANTLVCDCVGFWERSEQKATVA